MYIGGEGVQGPPFSPNREDHKRLFSVIPIPASKYGIIIIIHFTACVYPRCHLCSPTLPRMAALSWEMFTSSWCLIRRVLFGMTWQPSSHSLHALSPLSPLDKCMITSVTITSHLYEVLIMHHFLVLHRDLI